MYDYINQISQKYILHTWVQQKKSYKTNVHR